MITFKQYLYEHDTKSKSLAKKLGISNRELASMSDNEVHYLLKDVGNYDFTPDTEFDSNELEKGIKVEKEHTKSLLVAKLIAKDHLKELPDYYTRLSKMEKEAEIND